MYASAVRILYYIIILNYYYTTIIVVIVKLRYYNIIESRTETKTKTIADGTE